MSECRRTQPLTFVSLTFGVWRGDRLSRGCIHNRARSTTPFVCVCTCVWGGGSGGRECVYIIIINHNYIKEFDSVGITHFG